MKRFRRIAICLVLICMYCRQEAPAKETILWLENDFPPVWILDGPFKGQGGADQIQALMINNLTEYDHTTIVANNSRFHAMAKQGKNVCSCATFKTADRENFMHFNRIPSSFVFPNGIITKKTKRHLFGEARPVSLERILLEGKLSLGIEIDRKFSIWIDDILSAYGDSPRIHRRYALNGTRGLIDMMMLDRIDFLIGFDWEFQYLVRHDRSPEQAAQLIWLPVQETRAHLISYIACAKTDWGRRVVQRIDQVLEREIHTPGYRRIWEQWMSDQDLYKRRYLDFFLKYVPAP